jgi:hypothetical protein
MAGPWWNGIIYGGAPCDRLTVAGPPRWTPSAGLEGKRFTLRIFHFFTEPPADAVGHGAELGADGLVRFVGGPDRRCSLKRVGTVPLGNASTGEARRRLTDRLGSDRPRGSKRASEISD